MLALVAVAFAVGIAVGEWLALGRGAALAAALVCVALVAVARRRERWVGLALLGLAAALGTLAVAHARPRLAGEAAALVDGAPWIVEGEVARAAERTFGVARLDVDLVTVERAGQRWAARGRVRVVLGGEPPPLLPGDRVRFVAPLRVPRGFANPGAPDAARRAAADGVVAIASLHDPAALSQLAAPPPDGIVRRLAGWRARMLAQVGARLGGSRRALVASLVLGDRGEVSHELDDAFRTAGVSHVLSVSGLHLAVAAFLFYWGGRRALLWLPRVGRGRPVRRWAAAAALPATAAYTLITGAQVATVRAFVVAAVFLGAVALGRRATTAQALAIAAVVILAASPLELFDPSFQLSFAAALGTGLLGSRWSPTGDGGGWGLGLARWAGRLLAASAAAIVATLPIGAWHFAQVAPAGLLTNLVVVPLAELLVVPIGLAGCVAATAWASVGAPLLWVAGALAALMAGFVRWCAAWAPSWRVGAPTAIELCAWYAGWGALALGWRRGRLYAAVGVLVVAGSLAARAAWRATTTTLTATFLDVGQGDASVVELPHGRVMVIDGGGSFDPAFDPGAQVVAPYLWRRGIRRIDVLVLSHPHPDHANGLPFLVENFAIGEVWEMGQETALPALMRLRDDATARAIPRGPPRALELGGVTISPLAPLGEDGKPAIDPAASENDSSIVLRLQWGGRVLVWSGDIEAEAERRVAERVGRVDVLKVPHHGSRTSSTAALLDAARPAWAVISVGDRNRWGFPHASVVERYRQVGAQVRRTDRDGAVVVTVGARGDVEVETMR